jgi:hypothetical protein
LHYYLTVMPTRFLSTLMLSGLLLFGGCSRPNPPATNSTNSATVSSDTQSPAPAKTGFEADLEYVRKGQYTYVWVFSRKDGNVLDRDDSAYLRTNAPQVVDWVTADGGKKVIAGTNFDLALGNLELLKKRFVVEDYTGK